MMKNNKTFVAGVMATLAMLGTITPVLAVSNALTLTAYPVQVIVEGEVFYPETGDVYLIDGTTYAPVRALAEAYGLDVGYDHNRNLVTVSGMSTPITAANDFAAQWTVRQKPVTNYGDEYIFTASYSGSFGMNDFKRWWKSFDENTIRAEAERLAADAQNLVGGRVTMYFDYQGWALGTVYAFGDLEQSDFRAAGAWIK